MMKKSLVVVSLLLVGTSAVAQNYFIGADYVSADITFNTKTTGGAVGGGSISDKDKNLNLKFGIDNIYKGRIYIKTGTLFNARVTDVNLKYKSTSINYDYYIGQYNKFTPFAGIYIGKGSFEFDSAVTSGLSASGNGIEYGVKVGSLVKMTDNTNFEFGYNYGISNVDAKWEVGANSATIEVDKIKALYFGFNYKF